MPAQATRGIWHPYYRADPKSQPKASGVRKVTLSASFAKALEDGPYVTRSWHREAYAYYSAIDDKWYKADGSRQHFVTGYYSLSR